jgi:hypothetical protein
MTGPTLAWATQQASPSDNALRTGTVHKVHPDQGVLTVDVGGRLLVLNRLAFLPVPAVGSTVALLRQEGTWLVLGAIPGGRTPRTGTVGAGISTTTALLTHSAGAEVVLPVASWVREPRFTPEVGRIYRLAWRGRAFVSGGVIAHVIGGVRVRVGSATITGPLLGTWHIDAVSNFEAVGVSGWTYFRITSGGGSVVAVSVGLVKVAGTGTNINLTAATTEQIIVTIEDVTDDQSGDPSVLAAVAVPVAL